MEAVTPKFLMNDAVGERGTELPAALAFRRRHEELGPVELWAATLFSAADNQTEGSARQQWQ
jgi:hypothetical protein